MGIGAQLAPRGESKQEELLNSAAHLRHQLWMEAVEAQANLGDPPAWIPETEHLLRQNVHDCVYPRHEKDYRSLQTLSGGFLDGVTLVVLRISYFGKLEADLLHGAGAEPGTLVFTTIHRGHMRLLQPHDPSGLFQALRDTSKVFEGAPGRTAKKPLTEAMVPSKLPPAPGAATSRSVPIVWVRLRPSLQPPWSSALKRILKP